LLIEIHFIAGKCCFNENIPKFAYLSNFQTLKNSNLK